jgi:hypothetical protein
VLRSQYGITGSVGVLSIQKDASGAGGYKVTGVTVNGLATPVRTNQGNFFVSTTGQLSGTLPLAIGAGGSVKDVLFSGIRFKDAVSAAADMSEYAGNYGFGLITADVGTGANVAIGAGVFNIAANGSGRLCGNASSYSASCTNGIDFVASFDDPATRNLLRLRTAASQSQPIAAGFKTGLDMLAVVRKFETSNISFTGDLVATGPGQTNRTGAIYASRFSAAARSPSTAIGAWNYTYRSTKNAVPGGSALVAVADVGGVIKSRDGERNASGQCTNASGTLTAGPGGSLAITTAAAVPVLSYFIPLDTDLAVVVETDAELGLARRFSTDPTKAPCQPN